MEERIPLKARKKLRKSRYDHILHKRLKDAGYTNRGISRLFGIGPEAVAPMFRDNCKGMTLSQVVILAGLLEIPVCEVVLLAVGIHEDLVEDKVRKWYESR